MSDDSAFGRFTQRISDKLQDQVWFQQAKVKWDELDARSKMAVKYILLVSVSVCLVGGVGSYLYTVADKKHEIEEKLALIQKIQSAQDELRRLKDVTSRFSGGGDQPWGQFIQEQATPAGISPESVKIVTESVVAGGAAPAPAPKSAAKGKEKTETPPAAAGPEETVVEASLERVNVRQLTKFVHAIENGGRTVKVRRLQVDAAPDESGYLTATVVVSAFRLKQ